MSVEAGLLRRTREYLGMSLDDAALEAGIAPEALAVIEGPEGQPDELRLRRIANAYDINPTFFERAPEDSREDGLVAIGRLAEEFTGADLDEALFFAHLLRFSEE